MNRKAPVIVEETTYFRVFPVTNDAGVKVGFETRQRVIIRDENGVLRHAYRLAGE